MSKTAFTLLLDDDIREAIEQYRSIEKQSITAVIEDAIKEYLRNKGYWPLKDKE